MKKLVLLFSLTLLVACKTSKVVTKEIPLDQTTTPTEEVIEDSKSEELTEIEKVEFIKLRPATVNAAQKQKAYELGKRILMTCNTSKFKPFTTAEATHSVINNITIDKLSTICNRYRTYYGTFNDIELVEVLKSTKNSSTIYRYKALYSKKVANKELRVTMNAASKVSAIQTMDWNNSL
ncbi:hypothetical protein FFWV33_16305 [Flavobacterium faecale]|uniref:Lipoprotein n=1 Tax=Flavobacterium faecale TaxID=1355330 RepID=A0A2S1LGW8_9FLAO|nr:hypothetical protein [Flavobacterium faecale]AWG22977.1 hypothetical protein FFWV33_16305 [Flavobacterium faecale]